VKRQYLFHSFWSSLTVVLLTTHPAGAKPAPVNEVQLNPTISDNTFKPAKAKSPRADSTGKAQRQRGKLVHSPQASAANLTAESSSSKKPNQTQPLKTKQQLTQTGQQSPAAPPDRSGSNTNSPESQQQLQRLRPTPNQPDLGNRSAPFPNYLNQNPNPLQFPTQPREVQILGIQPVTLQQALAIAGSNNRNLQAAQLTVERSRAAVREALAAEYPQLNLNAGYTNRGNYVLSNQPNLGFNQDNNTNNISGTLSLDYNLFTFGLRSGRIRAAEEQLRFDQLDFERISEELRLNVSTDYYNLQQADESVRIERSAVTNAQASLRDAQALEQAGVGTRFDVLQAQVQLAQAQQRLTEALNQQRIRRRQLATRLGIADQPVNLATADPVEIAGLWNLGLEESIVRAFQNRAELEQQLAQRSASQQRRQIALAQRRPQVSLSANYNANYSLDNTSNQFNNEQDFRDNYTLGANLRLNLYDGGAARARARQEEANIAIAETNFANQRNQIRFEVEQAYSTLQSSLENIQTATVALEQAREALRLARLRFQAGVGTQTDVINAENSLTQAEGDRVRAILDYNRSLAQIQRAISSGQQR